MAVDLKKKAETAGIDLSKKGLPTPPLLACAMALDVSGSMQSLYDRGDVQVATDQMLGAALRLDDDGSLPAWTFDNRPYSIGEATEADGGTFVRNKVLRSPHLWGGTEYAPVLRQITKALTEKAAAKPAGFLGGLFGKKPAAAPPLNPALVFFQTDGDNSREDQRPALQALEEAQSKDIFFQMIGVGGAAFSFLRDAESRFPNVSLIKLSGLNNSDEAFYKAVFSDKFVAWAKKYPPRPAA